MVTLVPSEGLMNLRRGLFRFWIVGSALFVLAVAFINYDEIEDWAGLARATAIALGIPLAVLALVAAPLWALSGFDDQR
jgi:hypothetical protein